jgi:hypothetical protein
VPTGDLPAVAEAMLRALPPETYDPAFAGQRLETTYFDTSDFDLRKARRRGKKYLTLRLRCYAPVGGVSGEELYALSAKTEAEKFRKELPTGLAEAILAGTAPIEGQLPGHLYARLVELANGSLIPVVAVCCRRYAREDDTDRLTLDVGVHTNTGKTLPGSVLEFKSTRKGMAVPPPITALELTPLKLSKFLWATLWR